MKSKFILCLIPLCLMSCEDDGRTMAIVTNKYSSYKDFKNHYDVLNSINEEEHGFLFEIPEENNLQIEYKISGIDYGGRDDLQNREAFAIVKNNNKDILYVLTYSTDQSNNESLNRKEKNRHYYNYSAVYLKRNYLAFGLQN